jgi:putative ABC transport system permease protein
MLRNHLKIAWRTLRKNRLYTLLNVFGLTLGISGFLMIMLFIQDELNYDRFFPDSEDVFRVTSHWGDFAASGYATAPPPLGVRIQSDIPEVEAVTRLLKWNDFTIQPAEGVNKDQIFRESNVFYAEPGFFAVFDLPFLAGSKEKALADPDQIVITGSAAKRYFGQLPPDQVIGKQLLIGSNQPIARQVAAVVDDIPSQSHLEFDMLVYEPEMHREIFLMDNWGWSILYTYVRFPAEKQQVVKGKLDQMVANYAIPSLDAGADSSGYHLRLMPVRDIHLSSHMLREIKPNSYKSYVYIFSLVAVFVLLLACVNFMNLATAKAGLRSMEVGVRKVLGSGRSQLVTQFLTEAFLLVLVSVLISVLVVELCNPVFNHISGKSIAFNLKQNPMILGMVPALLVVLTLISGFYPAFYLSSFKPISVMKKQLGVGKNSHAFRNGLVVFQFATSLTLIICALLVQRQMSYIQNTNPGFDRDQLVIIHNDGEIQNFQREDFKSRLDASTQVQDVSFSTGIPLVQEFQMRSFQLPTGGVPEGMNWYEADDDFLDTYNFVLLEGRNFAATAGADSAKVIINEQAARQLGIWGDAIGQLIVKNQGEKDETTLEVVGLVRDFNFESFRHEIKPLVIEYMHQYFSRDYISVKIRAGAAEAGIAELNKVWKAYEPRVPMNYTFLDEDFGRVYQGEMKMADLLKVLTVISIVIACLGLFGLTSYTTHLRTKEIGIRKVFGATMPEIFMMLCSSYLKLLVVSTVIAVPLAVYFMDQWLEEFAFKTGIEFWVIVASALVCFALAIGTVFIQSYQSIQADPVDSLRSE